MGSQTEESNRGAEESKGELNYGRVKWGVNGGGVKWGVRVNVGESKEESKEELKYGGVI